MQSTVVTMATCLSAEPGRKAPYSNDLRWRIVWQRTGMDLSFRNIARNLNISISTAHSICKKFEETGDVSPKVLAGEDKSLNTDWTARATGHWIALGCSNFVPVGDLPDGLEDHWYTGFSLNHMPDHPQEWADQEEGSADCSPEIKCLSWRFYGRSPHVLCRQVCLGG